jgi:nicotinamide mononucleotide transporter
MSIWEIIATVLGVIGVWLMIRRSLWAFPIGLGQVLIFGWVCFRAGLYSETALQVMFFAALVHGWWHWSHPGEGRPQRPITRLTGQARLAWTVAAVALWLGWGFLMQHVGASLSYGDASVFAVSVVAQWLQARKHIENWPAWLVANSVAIAIFLIKGLYLFAGLYVIFWFMAVWGWREWRRAPEASHV